MSSCCSTPAPKEKKFGVKDCRERKCIDLQSDPKYPKSPQFCTVTHGMPGSMSCCVKEMPAEQFIRHISGQLNNSPYTAPNPGIKNCPATCPYKIITVEERLSFTLTEGKKNTKSVKVGKCALTGNVLGGYGGCPCNVLGNPLQDEQIKRLQIITKARLENTDPNVGLCQMGICPDGKDRGAPCTDDDRCPVIKMPYGDFGIGMGCPLWRIPAKLLPAPAIAATEDPAKTPEKTEKPVEEKQAASKKKKKEQVRSIEDRIDALERQTEIYLWADITQCCVLIQEVKCLFRRLRKSQAKVIPRKAAPRIEPNQSDLFSFDVQPGGVRPVELHAACLECLVLNDCKHHDPHAGCERETQEPTTACTSCKNSRDCITHTPRNNCGFRSSDAPDEIPPACLECQFAIFCMKHDPKTGCTKEFAGIRGLYVPGDQFREYRELREKGKKKTRRPKDAGTGGGPQPYVQHCCGTCGHHKGRKTFHNTCPRLGELLFKGGTKSAKVLMDETAATLCKHWDDKMYRPEVSKGPEPKKSASKKSKRKEESES